MHTSRAAALLSMTVASLTLPGCRDAAGPVRPGPIMSRVAEEATPLVPRIIAPQTTDPEINWIPPVNPQFNHHYVWLDPGRTSNPKLFVFLPGTGPGPRPRVYQLVQQEAARLGYYVIGLMYQNNVGLGPFCTGNPDPNCSGDMGLEIIDGIDRSAFVDVSPANSIDNRLTKLLTYLEAQYPGEGWSRFLKDGEPKWSQIAVAGHSGGAAAAALIGTIRHVDRVVMIAGPVVARVPEEPDAWVSIGATPAAKYFELVHQRDHFAAAIFANVKAFDLEKFGNPVAVELGQPPYDGTHILVTDLQPRGGYATPNPHLSTAVDPFTPVGPDGTPRLRDAWRYLLGSRHLEGDDDEDDHGRRARRQR